MTDHRYLKLSHFLSFPLFLSFWLCNLLYSFMSEVTYQILLFIFFPNHKSMMRTTQG